MSPELLRGKYNQSCDIWSMGVILYILLCGAPPFYGDTDYQILKMIEIGDFNFDRKAVWLVPEFEDVSDSAKDLIRQMLAPFGQRYSAEQVVRHPWTVQALDKHMLLQLETIKIFKSPISIYLILRLDRFQNDHSVSYRFQTVVRWSLFIRSDLQQYWQKQRRAAESKWANRRFLFFDKGLKIKTFKSTVSSKKL